MTAAHQTAMLTLAGARLCRPDQPQQFGISDGCFVIRALRPVLRTRPRSGQDENSCPSEESSALVAPEALHYSLRYGATKSVPQSLMKGMCL